MNIEQILPNHVTEDIPLKKALCLKTEKKNTGEVMKFLKSYFVDYEKSYFLFDKKQGIRPKDNKNEFKYGKYNLKNKSLIYKDQDKINFEDIDLENCDFDIYEILDISFLKRAKANESNSSENFIFLSFLQNLDYLKKFKNKDFLEDFKNFLNDKILIGTNSESLNQIKDYGNNDFDQILFYKEIPCIQPTTQKQINFCKQHWSILIQPSVYSKLIYQHSEKEKEIISNIYIRLKDLKSNQKNSIESLLYDPIKEKIVAQAQADETEFPYNIKHSVMKCIDNFCCTLTEDFILNKNINNQNDNGDYYEIYSEGRLLGKKDILPKFNSSISEINNYSINTNDNHIDKGFSNHCFDKLEQYYCQGLYLFTFKEPCFMCSMALVHSRIEKVYFIEYNQKEGALASLIKLNSYNLNHNFFVFKINE